jgi:hypothetical protein
LLLIGIAVVVDDAIAYAVAVAVGVVGIVVAVVAFADDIVVVDFYLNCCCWLGRWATKSFFGSEALPLEMTFSAVYNPRYGVIYAIPSTTIFHGII